MMPQTIYDPYGVNPRYGLTQQNIRKAYQGDTITLDFDACLPDGTRVDRDNCFITFTLKDQRFSHHPIWTGQLFEGITLLRPGTVRVAIPKSISDELRRGPYIWSLTVTDRLRVERKMENEGCLLIEYAADAPDPNVYYNGNRESQNEP